jgi:hypothetical protein
VDAVPIPEPGVFLALAVTGMQLLLRRRRRETTI